MEKLTWREWLKERWQGLISGLILWLAATGFILWLFSEINWGKRSSWWLGVFTVGLLVFWGIFFLAIRTSKNDIRRCSNCGEASSSQEFIKWPDCNLVCPRCGKEIEVKDI